MGSLFLHYTLLEKHDKYHAIEYVFYLGQKTPSNIVFGHLQSLNQNEYVLQEMKIWNS